MKRQPQISFIALALMIGRAVVSAAGETAADRIRHQLRHRNDRALVAAHRGDWRNVPENSRLAIEFAMEMGVDIVEVNVRRTVDGHFMLMHDETLDRTTTGHGRVDEANISEIRRLKFRNGYGIATQHRVPELVEVLRAVEGRAMLYLDKSEEHLHHLATGGAGRR